jgi:hypothetical protein
MLGAKERDTDEDRELVQTLMQMCRKKYGHCMFVSLDQQMGVGQFLRQLCQEKDSHNRYVHQLILCGTRLFAVDLPKAELVPIFMARNATLFELGDVFIYLANEERRGTIEELIQDRVKPSGRPYVVLEPGDAARIP